ncbi:MAG: sulfur oxidation c-type cytochrome SoxA [Methylomicrobium sp.]
MKTVCAAYLAILFSLITLPLHSAPLQDQQQLQEHYRRLFPKLQLSDYANGVYAIDPIARESWQAIEEFPPYEEAIEQGKKLFDKPFSQTGGSYAACFPDKGIGIAHRYPQWDKNKGEVVTLAKALNDCRERNHEKPLDAEKGEITQLLSYMAYTSRGKAIEITIPNDDPRALAAYQQGKDFYYRRHGQLNFACATCHVQNAGKRIRSEILSASLGHTANWPAYRLKWGEMGTLHRRFRECLSQIKADAPPAQSPILRNLEYFLSYMSNGVPVSGPSTRK